MECVVNGYEDRGDRIQVPAWVLASPDDNYLLLRTQETTSTDRQRLHEISYNARDRDNRLEFRRFGTEIGRTLPTEQFWKVFEIAEEQCFGGISGFDSFYGSFFGTFAIARECKLGFYHSHKDGEYRTVTQESLEDLLRLRYEQGLNYARGVLKNV
jgi:hypothetical protein